MEKVTFPGPFQVLSIILPLSFSEHSFRMYRQGGQEVTYSLDAAASNMDVKLE